MQLNVFIELIKSVDEFNVLWAKQTVDINFKLLTNAIY